MLPLNRMRGAVVPPEVVRRAESVVGGPGNVATALSLIRYPPHLAPVMEFVFGGVLVCPTLDQARLVAFHPGVEKRTITYDGDMFDPQGTLSGGSRGGGSGGGLLVRVAQWRAAENAASEALARCRALQEAREAAVARSRRRVDLTESLDRARHQLALIETNLRQSDTHRLRFDLQRLKQELGEFLSTRPHHHPPRGVFNLSRFFVNRGSAWRIERRAEAPGGCGEESKRGAVASGSRAGGGGAGSTRSGGERSQGEATR